jgi:hypothetical protein
MHPTKCGEKEEWEETVFDALAIARDIRLGADNS